MGYIVDNAVIMAAGTSSRFAPLSKEIPKALIEVRGEVLIERQIKQLREAGIEEIIIVVGYMKECFEYLVDKYGVIIIENNDYLVRNNNSSIYVAKNFIRNTYICSSDNYFAENPFEKEVDESYYAAVYADGDTAEWCMTEDDEGYVNSVTIGGSNAWYMLGHAFWNEKFSKRFLSILEEIYGKPETADMLWEKIYMDHLDELKLKMRKYKDNVIFEFDTLDELRKFDNTYISDTRSRIIKKICEENNWQEKSLTDFVSYKEDNNSAAGFTFTCQGKNYKYDYAKKKLGGFRSDRIN